MSNKSDEVRIYVTKVTLSYFRDLNPEKHDLSRAGRYFLIKSGKVSWATYIEGIPSEYIVDDIRGAIGGILFRLKTAETPPIKFIFNEEKSIFCDSLTKFGRISQTEEVTSEDMKLFNDALQWVQLDS